MQGLHEDILLYISHFLTIDEMESMLHSLRHAFSDYAIRALFHRRKNKVETTLAFPSYCSMKCFEPRDLLHASEIYCFAHNSHGRVVTPRGGRVMFAVPYE